MHWLDFCKVWHWDAALSAEYPTSEQSYLPVFRCRIGKDVIWYYGCTRYRWHNLSYQHYSLVGTETGKLICWVVIFCRYSEWIRRARWIRINCWCIYIDCNWWIRNFYCPFLDPSSNSEENFVTLDKIIFVSLHSASSKCFWKSYHLRKVFCSKINRKRHFLRVGWKLQRFDEKK